MVIFQFVMSTFTRPGIPLFVAAELHQLSPMAARLVDGLMRLRGPITKVDVIALRHAVGFSKQSHHGRNDRVELVWLNSQ